MSTTRSLAESNLKQLYNYSANSYNPILISMDGSRDVENIKKLMKEKNIYSVTYDSVDILNKIIKNLSSYLTYYFF